MSAFAAVMVRGEVVAMFLWRDDARAWANERFLQHEYHLRELEVPTVECRRERAPEAKGSDV